MYSLLKIVPSFQMAKCSTIMISDKNSWHTVSVVKTHAFINIFIHLSYNSFKQNSILVASWSILLYLRFDSNGSLSRYDVQKHRNIAAFLLFMLSGVVILARPVHLESDERRYVSNISGWFS